MSVFLHVRVGPRDKAPWRKRARARGLSLSAWVSARLNGDEVADVAHPDIEDELREGLRDLDRRLSRIETLAEGQGY